MERIYQIAGKERGPQTDKKEESEAEGMEWQKPTEGVIKLNCNGAVDAGSWQAGTGVVVQNEGELIDGAGRFVHTNEAEVAEMVSIQDGLKAGKGERLAKHHCRD